MVDVSWVLTQEERQEGFTLEENEDFVYLLGWGRKVAQFSSTVVTLEDVHRAIALEKAKGEP